MSSKDLAIVLDFDQVRKERDYFRIERPHTLPRAVEDHTYIAAVREYLMGASLTEVGKKLRKGPEGMASMVETAQWKRAEYLLRDDLRYTLYGQMGRMESKIVAEMWDRLEKGDTVSDMFGKTHRVPLSAVKLVEMHKQVTRVKDGLDKQMQKNPDRDHDEKDAKAILAALERFAADAARTRSLDADKGRALDGEIVPPADLNDPDTDPHD